ncbi:methyltransferase domain-containing protein [Rhodobacterales bacterium HKCCE3408]|nr:methyltransferase domain-containing protein [Rhodobacterales bacterium HKCCE3408]
MPADPFFEGAPTAPGVARRHGQIPGMRQSGPIEAKLVRMQAAKCGTSGLNSSRDPKGAKTEGQTPSGSRSLKEQEEIAYWNRRAEAEKTLGNGHYKHFFTGHFDLTPEDYAGKHVLDVGCGPRGSLEWCTMAASTTGADPLADEYLALGAHAHRMTYVATRAETMPFDDGRFDVISCFNALDHVDDVEMSLAEMHRCLAPAGLLLVIVEVNHKPTVAEPHCIDPAWLMSWIASRFELVSERRNGVRSDHNIYRSLSEDTPFQDSEAGILSLKLLRRE